MRALVGGSALCIVIASTGAVHAGDPPDVAAQAEELFREAKRLMSEGNHTEACPKLAESHRLDPAGGTLLTLALCHEAEGKTASAWAEFEAALTAARRDERKDREEIARERLAALEPRLCRLTIVVPDGARVPGLQIRRDGALQGEATYDVALPVDPGEHLIEVTAPGKRPASLKVSLSGDGAREQVAIPVLEDEPRPPAAPPALVPRVAPVVPIESTDRGSTQRTVAFVAGGVGVAALIAGGVLGVMTVVNQNEANDLCEPDPDGETSCEPGPDGNTAVELNESARVTADVSTVMFIGGGVALAAGVVLYFTAPRAAARSTALVGDPRRASTGVRVRF